MKYWALTLIRLGPCCAYALAAALLMSMVLLAHYPSSALIWSLYMTILPVMREPVFLLLDGLGFEAAMAMLVLATGMGIHLAARPERYPRIRFIHAHIALIATALGVVRAASAQAGLSGLSFPQLLRGDWSLLPMTNSTLWIGLFLLVSAACLASHIGIIRRIRLQ
jgi:hypothetical protein